MMKKFVFFICLLIAPALLYSQSTEPAAINYILPDTAKAGETLDITIKGVNTSFSKGDGASISFNFDATINSKNIINDTVLTANITISKYTKKGDYSIFIEDSLNQNLSLVNAFHIDEIPPALLSVSPDVLTAGQSYTLTINGENTHFIVSSQNDVNFNFNAIINYKTVINDSVLEINISLPKHMAKGFYDISIINEIDGTISLINKIEVIHSLPSDLTFQKTDEKCSLGNGSIKIENITGGTAPFLYNFNGRGYKDSTVYNNLTAGSYTLIVKDSNGYIFNAPNIIIIDNASPTAVIVEKKDATCSLSNGQVEFQTVTGGKTPYTFSFNNLGFFENTKYASLSPKTYSLVVKDSNGCVYTAPSIKIEAVSVPKSISLSTSLAACNLNNGKIDLISVNGGVHPYSYSLDKASYIAVTNFENLAAKFYTLSVKDSNLCTYDTVIDGNNCIVGAKIRVFAPTIQLLPSITQTQRIFY